LVQRYYDNLWLKKMGRLEALREAQLWLMRGRDESGKGQRLPPHAWAGFVLSGDWR
jgi:CHAT domain-containing protein